MGKKKEHHEEHPDEAWLLPYADLLTLLLALFIVMFAMGQTDKEKMIALAQQFNVIFAGGSGIIERGGQAVISPIQTPEGASSEGQKPIVDSKAAEDAEMQNIEASLNAELAKAGYSDTIKVGLTKEGLDINIEAAILFEPGSATILKAVNPPLLKICKALSTFDNEIVVMGYTDNVPTNSAQFRTNWELSASRAINVMNFMVKSGKLNEEKMSIRAFGEFKPKYDNSTVTGRAKNRRVEIFVARKFN